MYLLSLHLTEHIAVFTRVLRTDRLRCSGIDSQIPDIDLRIVKMSKRDIIKSCIQQFILIQRNVRSISPVQQQNFKILIFFRSTSR